MHYNLASILLNAPLGWSVVRFVA